MSTRYVIIGASAAGIAAAQKLRQLDAVSEVVCIALEKEMPYNKCMLADYVAGIKSEDQIYTLRVEQAEQKNIQYRLGVSVTQIVPEKKQIIFFDGTHLTYDKLLLAV